MREIMIHFQWNNEPNMRMICATIFSAVQLQIAIATEIPPRVWWISWCGVLLFSVVIWKHFAKLFTQLQILCRLHRHEAAWAKCIRLWRCANGNGSIAFVTALVYCCSRFVSKPSITFRGLGLISIRNEFSWPIVICAAITAAHKDQLVHCSCRLFSWLDSLRNYEASARILRNATWKRLRLMFIIALSSSSYLLGASPCLRTFRSVCTLACFAWKDYLIRIINGIVQQETMHTMAVCVFAI